MNDKQLVVESVNANAATPSPTGSKPFSANKADYIKVAVGLLVALAGAFCTWLGVQVSSGDLHNWLMENAAWALPVVTAAVGAFINWLRRWIADNTPDPPKPGV